MPVRHRNPILFLLFITLALASASACSSDDESQGHTGNEGNNDECAADCGGGEGGEGEGETCAEKWTWNGLDWDKEDLDSSEAPAAVADLDGDGDAEIVALHDGLGRIIEDGQRTAIADGVQYIQGARIGDFDGDGSPDIVTGTFDGTLHRTFQEDGIWVTEALSTAPISDFEFSDVNEDGVDDIVAVTRVSYGGPNSTGSVFVGTYEEGAQTWREAANFTIPQPGGNTIYNGTSNPALEVVQSETGPLAIVLAEKLEQSCISDSGETPSATDGVLRAWQLGPDEAELVDTKDICRGDLVSHKEGVLVVSQRMAVYHPFTEGGWGSENLLLEGRLFRGASADFNGDGDEDLAVCAQEGCYLLSSGTGAAQGSRISGSILSNHHSLEKVVTGDSDQDGRHEIYVQTQRGECGKYLIGVPGVQIQGCDDGEWSEASMFSGDSRLIGLLDFGGTSAADAILLQDGAVQLVTDPALGGSDTRPIELAGHEWGAFHALDATGDGILDIFYVAKSATNFATFLAQGNDDGTFEPAQLWDSPSPLEPQQISPKVGDFDGDGDTEVLLAATDGLYLGKLRDGSWQWTLVYAPEYAYFQDIAAFPESGGIAVLFANYAEEGVAFGEVYIDVDGNTEVRQEVEALTTNTRFGDFDGDGQVDVLSDTLGWTIFTGESGWTDTMEVDLPAYVTHVGDANGDDRDDVLACRGNYTNPTQCEWYLSSGGNFAQAGTSADFRGTPTLVDWDGDGELDLVGTPWSTN